MMSSPILILLVAAQCAALQLRPGCAITAGLSTAAPLPPLMLAKKGKKKGGKDPSRPPRAAPAPAAMSSADAHPATSLPPLSPLPPLIPLPPVPPKAPSAPAAIPAVPVGRPVPQVPLVLAEGVDPSEAVVRAAMPSSGAAERPAASTASAAAPPEDGEALRLDRNIRVDDEPILRLPSFDDFAKRDGGRGTPGPAPMSGTAKGGAESRLPPINPGKPLYQPKEEEKKSLAERIVFQSAWIGIGTLVAIEIFINTPIFQQVKPGILSLLGSESTVTAPSRGNAIFDKRTPGNFPQGVYDADSAARYEAGGAVGGGQTGAPATNVFPNGE